MKVKCLRFECEECTKLASIQVFHNKSGTIKYARARHYAGQSNGKPQFEYHPQSLDYVKSKIGQHGQAINVDLEKSISSSELKLEPSAGFGPATITLPR